MGGSKVGWVGVVQNTPPPSYKRSLVHAGHVVKGGFGTRHRIAPEVSKVSERKLEGGMMLESGRNFEMMA